LWRSSVVGAGAGGSIADDYLFFSGATLGLRPSGVNVESTGASNYAYGRRTASPPNLQSSIVIAFTADSVGGGTARGLFKSNENQDYSGLSASTSTSAQLVFIAGQAGLSSSDRRNFTFSGTLTAGQFYVAALAIDDFASGRAFLNGTSVSLSYGGSSPSYLVGSGGVQLGRSLPSGISTWRYMVGGIAAWATFSRPLTNAELFELSINPWQLFRAPRRVIYSTIGNLWTINCDISSDNDVTNTDFRKGFLISGDIQTDSSLFGDLIQSILIACDTIGTSELNNNIIRTVDIGGGLSGSSSLEQPSINLGILIALGNIIGVGDITADIEVDNVKEITALLEAIGALAADVKLGVGISGNVNAVSNTYANITIHGTIYISDLTIETITVLYAMINVSKYFYSDRNRRYFNGRLGGGGWRTRKF
jgi:hypothetical protein